MRLRRGRHERVAQAIFGKLRDGHRRDGPVNDQDRGFDCGGNVTRRDQVKYRTIGAQADIWATPTVRLSAAGGGMHATSDSNWTDARNGAYGSGLVAFEGSKIGIGSTICRRRKKGVAL